MPLPLLPLVVGSLVAAAYHKSFRTGTGPAKGVLTPERQMIFETAIKEVKDPDKLRTLSQAFREQGLPGQADMLEKRANLRAMPEATKTARREVYRRAMKSTDGNAIRNLANAYEREGATGAAESLREYAASLPVIIPGTTPAPAVAVTPVPPAPQVIVVQAQPAPEAHAEPEAPHSEPHPEALTVEEEIETEE